MSKRVLLLGATGTIGRATCAELVARGHDVVCLVRRESPALAGATVRIADVTDAHAVARDGIREESFDALVSCLASRSGAPADAWAIDHDAHLGLLRAAQAAAIPRFVLLSAICVQRPRLAFQNAKLAFEVALIASGLAWSIVRPTAYMKSLSGQVARVAAGKPYLMFGDGQATACKPIADADLAVYLADCLDLPERAHAILPIGGPGPAITPRAAGELLFELTGRPPRYRRVPPALLDAIVATLGTAGRVAPKLAAKAELARIGRYYATESMLLWDEAAHRYDADATPETGCETLRGHYARMLRGEVADDRGEHAVF